MQHVAISDANGSLFMNSIESEVRRYIKFDRDETMLQLYRAWKCDNGTEFVRLPAKPIWRDPSVNLAARGFRGRSDLRRAIQVSVGEIRKLIGPTLPGATTISKLNQPLADGGIPGASPGGRLKGDSILCVSRIIARGSCVGSLYAFHIVPPHDYSAWR